MTAPAVTGRPVEVDDDPDVGHYVCDCDQDIALCGWDVTNEPWVTEESEIPTCPMCLDMLSGPCPRCQRPCWGFGDL